MLTLRRYRCVAAGFTLIEALIVILILAVLAGLAAPNFRTLVLNYRVRTAAESIMSGLQLARAEAIRLNTGVSFTLGDSGGWSVAMVSPSQTLQRRAAGESGGSVQIASEQDQTALIFTSTGRVLNYAPSTNLTQVSVTAPGNGVDALQINVFAGGQSRMCSPSITAADDPRKC